jgi:hypothetical protein
MSRPILKRGWRSERDRVERSEPEIDREYRDIESALRRVNHSATANEYCPSSSAVARQFADKCERQRRFYA